MDVSQMRLFSWHKEIADVRQKLSAKALKYHTAKLELETEMVLAVPKKGSSYKTSISETAPRIRITPLRYEQRNPPTPSANVEETLNELRELKAVAQKIINNR
ncbi:Hypothetical protein NTJ_11976 [Nesidiocoris tenuis]|uniref:Uncharacterized protein n=1 Tax=Nesidiocoris tenuis TaxID=355587 RepID=A0ABN7B439_9HEMI|nr:Hypothetical protein NTJ_11976 [Nesidiocoris tenuis]